MYTDCVIRFLDEWSEMSVTIKTCDSPDVNDNMIFYYGLSRYDLLHALQTGEPIDNEWVVVSVGETYDELY